MFFKKDNPHGLTHDLIGTLQNSRREWLSDCTCGWVSPPSWTEALALQAWDAHKAQARKNDVLQA